jgi:MoxR-like ATPase
VTLPVDGPERLDEAEIQAAVELVRRLQDAIVAAVEVREELLEHVIVCVAAEGHVLVEDLPGVGKTTLARAVARALDLQFARVQCTADLLPADVVGTNVFNQREDRFEFRPDRSSPTSCSSTRSTGRPRRRSRGCWSACRSAA